MLGAERAESMLRAAAQLADLTPKYTEVPNSSSFFVKSADSEVVFFKDNNGEPCPAEFIVSKRAGAWTLKLSAWAGVKGNLGKNGLQHSRISCARACQEGFELTGEFGMACMNLSCNPC